jgi:hypothetical protein
MSWLIWLLAGIIIGLVLGVLIDRDTVFKGLVKIKQKGRGNTLNGEFDVHLSPQEVRKQARQFKRAERKKRKALKRI